MRDLSVFVSLRHTEYRRLWLATLLSTVERRVASQSLRYSVCRRETKTLRSDRKSVV